MNYLYQNETANKVVLFKVDNHNLWIFVVLLIFATLMLFSADTLITSLTKFIKNNENDYELYNFILENYGY